MTNKQRVVSGMRPTGRLHLGNYWGALHNWVDLQDKYDCYYFCADWHSLTTSSEDTAAISQNSYNLVVDWLTAGINPDKCIVFQQSKILQIAELHTLLSMITPLGMLLRNPTYKEQLMQLFKQKYAGQEHREAGAVSNSMSVLGAIAGAADEQELNALAEMSSYGFLGYPVLQTADIIVHNADFVPVGKDQVAHVEISRDLARRFNDIYKQDVFTEPKALVGKTERVPGVDGRKMSKSYGNSIEIGEAPETLKQKVMAMYTDPDKKRATDPANPEGCVVFAFHQIYNPAFEIRREECKKGQIGCVACKKQLLELMEPQIKAFSEKRETIVNNKDYVYGVLETGNKKARESAEAVLEKVRSAMRLV